MIRWNRGVIFLLVFALLLLPAPYVSGVMAAEEAAEELPLDETVDYLKLLALGIIEEDDDLIYEDTVSRGRFLAYVIRMCGYSGDVVTNGTPNPFADLDTNNLYYGEILAAYQIGFISGAGNALVRPDDPVTLAEAAKILAGALGYGEYCEAKGGYPSGYLAVTAQLGLFSGDVTETITPAELLPMLRKTLETDLFQIDRMWLEDEELSFTYESREGQTLLNRALGVTYETGVLDSDEYTSLYGAREAGNGMVCIDGNLYRVGDTQTGELLGYGVEFYYRTEGIDRVLLYIGIEERKNDVNVVHDEEISAKDTTETQFVYFSDTGREQRLRLSATVALIVNGGLESLTKEKLCPENGTVTLIDNNGDGIVEVVKVDSYRILRADVISDRDYTITDAMGGASITLDATDSAYDVIIVRDGEPADFESIAEDDVISYAESSGNVKNIKRLLISSKTVSGMVEETEKDAITVNGTSYPVAKTVTVDGLLGTTGMFYLDHTGRIVDWEGAPDVVYGYLEGLSRTSELDNPLFAHIFTENNRWVILQFSQKVSFNDISVENDALLTLLGSQPTQYRQLITYTVNADGQINKLWTAKKEGEDFIAWSDTEAALIETGTFRLSRTIASAAYRSASRSFNGQVSVSSDAKLFVVPDQDASGGMPYDEFSIMSANGLIADRTYTNIQVYDMNESGVSDVCVLTGSSVSKSVYDRSNLLIVGGVTTIMNQEDEVVPALRIWYGDEKVSVPLVDETVVTDAGGLQEGDVIQCAFDADGCISAILKRFDMANGLEQAFMTGGIYAGATFAAGTIRSYDSDTQTVLFDSGDPFVFSSTGLGNVYVYDTERKRVDRGTVADLQEGEYAFVRLQYLQAKDVVIYQ